MYYSGAARVSTVQGWALSSVGRVLSLIPSTMQSERGGELVFPALRSVETGDTRHPWLNSKLKLDWAA